jgi:uncharacterized protein YqfA (UPF0365 family)
MISFQVTQGEWQPDNVGEGEEVLVVVMVVFVVGFMVVVGCGRWIRRRDVAVSDGRLLGHAGALTLVVIQLGVKTVYPKKKKKTKVKSSNCGLNLDSELQLL